ncbi:hypothetical protein HDU85_001841 [Gaertneriomyces sp. JEL0708]|nr:hypothetical protein HDU85_001841 [Gaertneriomyces sp. JEL0708]
MLTITSTAATDGRQRLPDPFHVRFPDVKYPQSAAAPLGAFPTPASAPVAGKSGAYASMSGPRPNLGFLAQQSRHPPPTAEDVENKLRAFVFAHRIRIAEMFLDFDRLRSGYVTATQFRRCLGGIMHKGVVEPLTEQEFDVLMEKYDAKGNRMIKWTNFVDSIDQVFGASQLERSPTKQVHEGKEVVKDIRPRSSKSESAYQAILATLRAYVRWHGSDVKTWFKDFDKHNNGYVTINQFRRGLPPNLLTSQEQDLLISIYSVADTVNYFKFNTDVNRKVRPYWRPDTRLVKRVEVDTTLEPVFRPLNPVENDRCSHLLSRLQTLIKQRGLLLEPQFKDFDMTLGKNTTNRVTWSHFSRVLSALGLEISDPDMDIICRRFDDEGCGRVNYMNFLEVVDPETYAQYKPMGFSSTPEGVEMVLSTEWQDEEQLVPSVDTLLESIRAHLSHKRMRVAQFFQDFERGRAYSIPRDDFVKGINQMDLPLSDEEFQVLVEYYRDEKKADCCRWKQLEEDVDKVFGESHFDGYPTALSGTASSNHNNIKIDDVLSREEEELAEAALLAIADYMRVRQVSVKPFFTEFDRLRTGYITKSQFSQSLHYLGIPLHDAQIQALGKKYLRALTPVLSAVDEEAVVERGTFAGTTVIDGATVDYAKDATGGSSYMQDLTRRICYTALLRDLDEKMTRNLESVDDSKAPSINSFRKGPMGVQMLSALELQKLILRLKTKVKTERIRVIDFMRDFDHLRHGTITIEEFKRVLKVLFLDLNDKELSSLAIAYISPGDHRLVKYTIFSDDMESVHTRRDLERNPTAEPYPFPSAKDYAIQMEPDELTGQERLVLDAVVERLRTNIRQKRVDILKHWEDFDQVNEGTIAASQLRSVLTSMGLPIDDTELFVFYRKFGVAPTSDRLDYRRLATLLCA